MKSPWLLWILPVLMVATAPAAERSWDGGATAGDNNWGTAANWSSDAAIVAGDVLSFQNATGTGTTTVNNNLTAGISYGLLYFMNSASNRAWVLTGNSITLGGDVVNSIAATQTLNLDLILSGNRTFYASSGNVVVGGVISETGGARALIKDGSFTLTLQNANSYTGSTTVRAGTLQLDFSGTTAPATNMISTAALTLGGTGTYTSGATLNLQGKSGATNSQTFASTTLNAGNHSVVLTQNGATSLSLAMGGINRNLGALLDFTLPTTGTVTTSAGTANTVLKDSGGVTYATVGGNDWAARGAAGNNIVGLSTISGGYTATTTSTLAGNADASTAGVNTSLGANTTNDSVRFSVAEARTLNLNNKTLTTGGILVSSTAAPAAGWNMITGGTLRAPTGRDLVVIQNSTTDLVIGANIVSSGLTKNGNGNLVLSGNNTISGAAIINSGTLKLGSSTALNGVTTMTLGNTAVGNTANLDLGSNSATVGGLTIKSRSLTSGVVTSTVSIQAGQTLTVNGDLRVGADQGGNDMFTSATFTGGGSLSVTGTTIQVGNNPINTASAASGSSATLNLSGLSSFTASVTTLRIGDATGGVGTGSSTLTLAANNDITATNLQLGTGRGGTETLNLGTGNNVLKVDAFNIGFLDGRSSGVVQFTNALGSLTLGGKSGQRVNLEVGYGVTGTGGSPTGYFDVRNHVVSLMVDTLTVGGRTTGSGGVTGTFQFNKGVLDANKILIAQKGAASTATTASFTGTVNLGGGTTVVGTGGITVSTNASAAGNAAGTLTISGGTVTVGKTGNTSITLTSATTSGGTSTGTLSLTGGVLSVAGDIIDAGGLGTTTSTFTLNGGTLNLNGSQLGTAAGVIDVINLQSGTIQNIGAVNGVNTGTGLTKTTAGTLVVSGANTYTGPTTINGGTVSVASIGNGGQAGTLGSSANTADNLVLNGGTLKHTGAAETSDRLFSLGASNGVIDASGTGALNLSNTGAVGFSGGTGARTLTLTGTNAGTNVLAAVLTNNGAAVNLLKNGSNTWRLTSSQSYTGSTTVNAGALEVDFGTSNTGTSRLDATSTLVLGGGTFRILGTSQSGQTTSQTVASTTLNPGASTIEVVANGDNAASLALGGITRNKGATVNFVLPSAGAISTTQANANISGGSQTILGGHATVGGNTWAVSGSGATAGVVSGLSTYSSTFTAGTDVDAPAGTSAPGAMTINSLRFNQSGGATVNTGGNLTIATGGILMTSAVTSAVSINNNNLTSGNGQDLIVHQHSTAANLTIASAITGSIGLTKSGAGNLILTGTNTYNGGTYVNGGQLTITKAGALGTGVTVINGGTLAASTVEVQLTSGYTMQVGANGGTLRHEGVRLFVQGVISDVAGQSGVLTITGNGTGDVVLSGTNTYSGGTILAAGSTTLVLNNAAFGTGTLTFAGGNIRTGSAIATVANAINFAANTTIPVTGTQVLTFSGNVTLTGGNRVLTSNATVDTTFSGSIGEEGGSYSFTKAGSGRVILTGVNTYSGGTILSGGTLNINSDANLGALPSTAATNITFAGGTSLQTNYSTNVELAATRNITINSGVTGNFHAHGLASFFVINGQISGAGNLGVVTSDGGILVLNGSNSYSGTTTLFGGANTGAYLRLGHASALGNTSLVTIGSGTTTELSRLELAIAGGATIDRNFSVYSRGNTSASFLNLNGVNTLTGTFTSAGAGTTHTIQSDGGRLNLSFSSVTNTRDLALQGAGDGSVNVSMFTAGSSATITKSGTGTWAVTAGQNTSGAVSITAGTYLANNTSGSATGSGAVTVSGGTLGGTGRVQGNTTISSVYGLRPGEVNSTGKLTFGGDLTLTGSTSPVTRLELQLGGAGAATYNDAAGIATALGLPGGLGTDTTGYYATVLATYEAETGDHDRLDIAGVLKLDANGRITVSSLGYNPKFGDVFDLMDWVGTLNLDADASGGQGFNLPTDLELPTLADGMYWDTTLFASNGILVAVPEPGRAVLLMLGVAVMLGRRKRRVLGS